MGAIDLDRVSLSFGPLRAVDNVSLEVRPAEIVGLLGHNGAGKTTLIRIINGLLRPESGRVRVMGRDPITDGSIVRVRTGVLTEYPALDEYLSAEENLGVYASINGVPRDAAAESIDRLLEQLDLGAKRKVPARDLSAGLKQRVALARALVHDPEILLLDEPTTNMDPVATRVVRDLIVSASRDRGRTVLLSSHDLAEAEELCDRVGIMRDGRLLSLGTPTELRRSLGQSRGVSITTSTGGAAAVSRLLSDSAEVIVRRSDLVEVATDKPVPHIVSQVAAAGVDVHRVEPLEPTPEDLYLHLHAGRVDVGDRV